MSHTPLNKRWLQQDSRYTTTGRPVWMMTAGTFPLPAIAHCDINDALGAQVGYSQIFTTDSNGNTATGAISGLTHVDVGSNAQLRALVDVNSQFGNSQYNLLSPITITYSDATTQTFTEGRITNITTGSEIGFGYNATTAGHTFPITVTTANYVSNQVDRNCELNKQINTRQYRVQPYGLNLLTNGNFASGTSSGWTTVSGTPAVTAGASSAATAYSFNNSANKYLVHGGNVVLTQSLTTVVGDRYRVEFAGYGLTGGGGNPYDSRVKVEIGASTLYNNYVSLDYYPAFYGPYVFKATSTTTVFKLTVQAVAQTIYVGHFSVRQLLPTRVAKLTAGVSTQTNQVDLTATDVNGNEYWVTKLQAHLCTVVPKNPSSGNLVYTSGKRAPWRESPAAGIYLDLNTTFSY